MRRDRIISLPVVVLVLGTGPAYGANDLLPSLVQTSAERLQLAEKVALAKWDSGGSVEDPVREEQVIQNAVREAETRGLNPTQVRDFFRAQIEANKVVQYSLLSDWLRAGEAPPHGHIDLVKEIRPQLDEIQKQLIEELAGSFTVRSSTNCRVDVAQAVGKYFDARNLQANSRDAVAIERAMAATCTQ
jgi:chorismate mutase